MKRSITISGCSKLPLREYNTRQESVGKMINWELCKKFKFDYTNKLYIRNPESVLENETSKILWDFLIKTDHLISARQEQVIVS